MNENLKDLFAKLAKPFKPSDIEWRAGATTADKTKALALAYITARAVMDRLDEVMGPENWRDEYAAGPDGGVICGLSLRINGEWITKWDGADNTEFEAVKGGLSDAFKRSGYKWGIGRYLYKLDSVWVSCEVHGKTVSIKNPPPLPDWALPNEWTSPSGATVSKPSREQEIMKELGFPPETPRPVVPPHPVVPSAAVQSDVGLRTVSWDAKLVSTMLQNGLAPNAADAVKMLNQSALPRNVTPAQVVAHFRQ